MKITFYKIYGEKVFDMKVLVLTSTRVLSEALVALLNSFGFDAHSDVEQPADVAIFNLMGVTAPYLAPLSVPTLALTESDSRKERDLLSLGYYRCFNTRASVDELVETLRALSTQENGLEQA